MTKLEDFLKPLCEGVWEVEVDKKDVTEPLSDKWEISPINVPTPGTIASYRKGRYHVHETETQWKVHLDRYDPKKHPIMHLIDDAPLLLMIGETVITILSTFNESGVTSGSKDVLETQTIHWKLMFASGILMLLAGLSVFSDPIAAFSGVTTLVFPLIIFGYGLILIVLGIADYIRKKKNLEDLRRGGVCWGIFVIILAILIEHTSTETWIAVFSGALSVWLLASSIIHIFRAFKGKKAVPEGFVSRTAIGLISLCILIIVMEAPITMVTLFVWMIAAIILIIGIVLIATSLKLRKIMKSVKSA